MYLSLLFHTFNWAEKYMIELYMSLASMTVKLLGRILLLGI